MGRQDRVAALAATLDADLVALRRDLHRNPELAFAETRTAALVAEEMRRAGAEVRSGVGGTGVLADLRGAHDGPTLLVRADMDALPIEEQSGLPFASQRRGAMHACGHDVHTSAAVGAARMLAEMRDDLHGTVRFCFQPAEETLSGARRMIADGAMDGVDVVLGAHVHAAAEVGTVIAARGPALAGGDFFRIEVRGRAGHGAMPHLFVDPVHAASQVVNGLQALVSRETRPGDVLVVSVTSFEGASAANVVRESVTLRGSIRWFDESTRERALGRLHALATGIAAAHNAQADVEITSSAPVSVNHLAVLDMASGAVDATGRARAVEGPPITATDDWACYLAHAPGAFLLVGAGGGGAAPHHHPRFTVDERAVGLMAEVLARGALRLLAVETPLVAAG
jgi:amidohydrolase